MEVDIPEHGCYELHTVAMLTKLYSTLFNVREQGVTLTKVIFITSQRGVDRPS